jgi:hypothetical protein
MEYVPLFLLEFHKSICNKLVFINRGPRTSMGLQFVPQVVDELSRFYYCILMLYYCKF